MAESRQSDKREPLSRLRRAVELLESDQAIEREYILAVEAPAAESVLTDQNLTAYEYHEVPLEMDALRAIQSAAESRAAGFLEEIDQETRALEEYDISKTNRDSVPLQFAECSDLDHSERFTPLLEREEFTRTTYEHETGIDFQALRITSQRTGERLLAFQKFSRRQISADSDELRLTLEGEQYDPFESTVVTIPDKVDCIWYEDMIYVFQPRRFEDIFDYLEQYKRQANEVLGGLEESELNIHNMDEFVDSIRNDRRALRKMDAVEKRGLYNTINQGDVQNVVDEFDLGLEVGTNDDGEWGITVPDLRKKWDVIRLLNDDHVESYLTDSRYQVYGKDPRN